MEERDVQPSSQATALHTSSTRAEMEGGGCRHSADLSDLWENCSLGVLSLEWDARITVPLGGALGRAAELQGELALCSSRALHCGLPAPLPLGGGSTQSIMLPVIQGSGSSRSPRRSHPEELWGGSTETLASPAKGLTE